jgi:hypothetical protein
MIYVILYGDNGIGAGCFVWEKDGKPVYFTTRQAAESQLAICKSEDSVSYWGIKELSPFEQERVFADSSAEETVVDLKAALTSMIESFDMAYEEFKKRNPVVADSLSGYFITTAAINNQMRAELGLGPFAR